MKSLVVQLSAIILLLLNSSEATMYSNVSLLGSDFTSQCTQDGDMICKNCQMSGICSKSGSDYTVVDVNQCPANEACDHTLMVSECFLSSSVCLCKSNAKPCNLDPNDSSSYVDCTDSFNPVYGTCADGWEVDLANCKCKEVNCPACDRRPFSDSDCSKYIYCKDGANIEVPCTGNLCFDETTCSCLEACPECGFKPGADDNSYIYCKGGVNIEENCPPDFFFNSKTCNCDKNSCPDCGYKPYPGDDTMYINCGGDTEVEGKCPSGFIYDSEMCICDQGSSSSCLSCGYKEFPGDNTKYIKCSDNAVGTCPTSYIFDPILCYCTT